MVALVSRKSPVQILGQSAVAVSHTGDTLETTLATITIPAGAMGARGQIEILTLWSYTNSANNKFLRVKIGGSTMASATVTTSASTHSLARICNRGASSQVAFASATSGVGSSSGAPATAAIDTTAATSITLTAQLASAGETITLESYIVKVYPAA